MRDLAALAAIALAVGGCTMTRDGIGQARTGGLVALMHDADGGDRGRVTVTQVGTSARLDVEVAGLPPGVHAIHLHDVGRCDAPGFVSAGPHWNPSGMRHGRDNPAGPHRGDLPNLTIATDGTGRATFDLPLAPAALLEGAGKAIIIHADADDYRTDPSGNSGGRIVCGVFAAG